MINVENCFQLINIMRIHNSNVIHKKNIKKTEATTLRFFRNRLLIRMITGSNSKAVT